MGGPPGAADTLVTARIKNSGVARGGDGGGPPRAADTLATARIKNSGVARGAVGAVRPGRQIP